MLTLLLLTGIGYLLGSIPFGLLLTRAAGLGDVRKIGSGNIGATNVLRTGNKGLAALTLLLDMLKGTAAVFVGAWLAARWQTPPSQASGSGGLVLATLSHIQIMTAAMTAGLGAFLGHVYPVWLGFKGGKGVATYIGVLIGVAWPAALVFAAVWLATAAVTRYSSLAALAATLATFFYLVFTGGPFVAPVVAIMSAVLFWKHRENIRRFVAGTESKIGAKG